MSNPLYERAQNAARFIRSKYPTDIRIAAVLGSGLGAFADELENAVRIDYSDIPDFARTTIEGHAGQLVLGELGGIPLAVMQGRFHYYEGHSLEQVTFPMRVFGALGVKRVILTNAAGGINKAFPPGSLMLITDHINFIGGNSLRGPNDDRFGLRFIDMSEAYSSEYREIVLNEAANLGTKMEQGVYLAVGGPSYESPAEIRAFRTLGADAVGMSTVPEATVARHQGMKVLGISVITNHAAGVSNQQINHEEVIEVGNRVRGQFIALLKAVIPKLT
jgi:purine-nucleoside phosphorylase